MEQWENLIQPGWIHAGDGIGVTAPSDGNRCENDYARLENGKKILAGLGYFVSETQNVRTSDKGRSSTAKERAAQFMGLIEDNRIKYIVSAKGGDYLAEMLPYLDYESIRRHPKWIQGYSDNTGLIHTVTIQSGIQTVYGNNFNDYGMTDWHSSVTANLEILEGNRKDQKSFDQYEAGFTELETGFEGYQLTLPVKWKITAGIRGCLGTGGKDAQEKMVLNGRLMGGCLDVLVNLCGTRFDQTAQFVRKFKQDGILWYLESFDLNAERLSLSLWQLREAGWFEGAVGFVFGRPAFYSEDSQTTFEEAVMEQLSCLGLPVITGADIGHKAPQLTMLNGARAQIITAAGAGIVTYER